MTLKKIIAITLCLIPFLLQAQVAQQRLKAYRAAIFTEVLQLTEDESKAFWPIYNEFDGEREAIKKEQRAIRKKLEFTEEANAQQLIDQMFDLEEKEIQIKRKYFEKFLNVLPTKKVLAIPKAEQQFRKALLERLQDRRRGWNDNED